jgi:hypothetical protein
MTNPCNKPEKLTREKREKALLTGIFSAAAGDNMVVLVQAQADLTGRQAGCWRNSPGQDGTVLPGTQNLQTNCSSDKLVSNYD